MITTVMILPETIGIMTMKHCLYFSEVRLLEKRNEEDCVLGIGVFWDSNGCNGNSVIMIRYAAIPVKKKNIPASSHILFNRFRPVMK